MSTRGRKAELKVIEGGLQETPAIPSSIPVDLHREWKAVLADLAERKLLNDATLPSIESYILAIGNMRAAQRSITEHGVLIPGRDGVPKQNPAVSLLGKAQTAIQRLSAELGLTPASRSRPKMKGDYELPKFGDEGQHDLFQL